MRFAAFFMVLAATLPSAVRATEVCPAGKRPLLILGTFHMQSSGQDAVNRSEDVGTAERQREIAVLVERLARFRPTKIAIESARNSTVWNDRYKQWLAGSYTLGMNEIEQIGFRLARSLNRDGLTPVDYPMWMNGLTPIERHEPRQSRSQSPSTDESALLKEIQAQVARDSAHLVTHTIAEHLAYLNEPRRAAMNHRWDVLSNLLPGSGVALYENTDLVTNWYKRNLRIFTNVLEATSPEDRVLLIIGAGHVKILSDWAADHPEVCLVAPAEYLLASN